MKLRHLLSTGSILFALIPLAGCNDKNAAQAKPEDYVAVVNDSYISRDDYNAFLTQKQAMQPGAPQNPDILIKEMVNMELLRQEALKQKIDERGDIAKELERMRTNVLVQTLVREYVDSLDFSEEAMKKEYEESIAGMPKKEFKASHILLKTEEDAKAVIAELDKGTDFAELAKSKSTGPSGPNGGSLGWFTPQRMVPEFSAAVATLDKGKYSKMPTQTSFGWHVILLEDERDAQLPSLEDIKPQLKNMITQRKITDYIDGLNQAAKVEITLNQAAPAIVSDSGATDGMTTKPLPAPDEPVAAQE